MNDTIPTPQLIANRYQIIERIGQGGMGDVFKGIDTHTQQSVAIKRLKPDILELDPSLLERFVREGEALRKLNHPNIVKMLNAIEENDQHYIILQYVAGGSLRDLLDESGKLPIDRVLAIGIELADALTRAHHLKIIHRDLKPANVLIDADGTPLLTDFGVARIDSRTRVTETGSVIGTYAYLSPEACMGEFLDARADIWSFGVILYEMLTGQRPFDHEQSTAVLLAIINNPLPNLTALRADVPPTLIQLIDGMLQKNREERVPSVRLVGAALEAIQSGATTSLPASVPLPGQRGDEPSRFATPTPTSSQAPDDVAAARAANEDPIVIFGPPTGERALQQSRQQVTQQADQPRTSSEPMPTATTSTTPPGATPTPLPSSSEVRWKSLTIMFTATLFAAVTLVAILLFSGVINTGDNDGDDSSAGHNTSAVTPTTNTLPPTRAPGQLPPPTQAGPAAPGGQTGPNGQVVPVGPNAQKPAISYNVLVAQIEPVGDVDERDVSRFIANDLTTRLESEIQFSNIRVLRYDDIITDMATAQQIAIQNNAAVIVWGNYNNEAIQLSVQLGVTAAFPHAERAIFANDKLSRRLLETTANVTVRLTNEREQSVAIPVLNVLNVMQTADGNAYETLRLIAIMDAIDTEPGEIVSGGVGASLHKAQLNYLSQTSQAIEGYTAAIDIFPSNPIPYVFRAAGYLRLGEFEKALADITSAERLGPSDWTTPLYLRATYTTAPDTIDDSIAYLDDLIALRPDDWFAYNYRGSLYYLQGDYDRAETDLLKAVDLGPNANFPYLSLFTIALRRGEFATMQDYLQTALTAYGDPIFSLRIAEAFFGEGTDYMPVFGPMYGAFGDNLLGQYDRALENVDLALAINDQIADLYLIQGSAYCALGDYAAAEAAYTRGIEVEPDYIALYAMRAETRLRQGNLDGVADDSEIVLQSDLAPTFAALMQAGLTGDWRCDQFYEFDFSSLKPLNPDELAALESLRTELFDSDTEQDTANE